MQRPPLGKITIIVLASALSIVGLAIIIILVCWYIRNRQAKYKIERREAKDARGRENNDPEFFRRSRYELEEAIPTTVQPRNISLASETFTNPLPLPFRSQLHSSTDVPPLSRTLTPIQEQFEGLRSHPYISGRTYDTPSPLHIQRPQSTSTQEVPARQMIDKSVKDNVFRVYPPARIASLENCYPRGLETLPTAPKRSASLLSRRNRELQRKFSANWAEPLRSPTDTHFGVENTEQQVETQTKAEKGIPRRSILEDMPAEERMRRLETWIDSASSAYSDCEESELEISCRGLDEAKKTLLVWDSRFEDMGVLRN
jgi:hypothetical protein